ncbi:glycosyltransferase family 39 protein [Geojedonia litorea]|uniref:glycosyltransferase family 39 protein n=1 Tax=Geojedonia litorea TaxID=1268269 RepID=UPI0036D99A0C
MLGLVVGTLLLLWQANEVPLVSYADGVSYMGATGNQGLYEHNILTSQWVEASQWQAFWKEASSFQWNTIRHDMAHYDIHPPLYFWVLHVWTHIVGVQLSTGPLLNIGFHLLTALLMVFICLRLRSRAYVAVAAGLFWFLNSSMVTAAQETRQYSLLALMAVLYVCCVLVYLQKKSNAALGGIAIAATLGMLTHYHFALLIGVSVIYLIFFFLTKNEWQHLLKYAVALSLGAVLFILLHPDFYVAFERQAHQAQVFAAENILPRTIIFKSTLIELFKPKLPIAWVQKLTLWLGIIVALLLSFNYTFKQKKGVTSFKSMFKKHQGLPLIVALGISICIFTLYVFQFSPKHAMNPKYIILVTPFYFIVAAQFCNRVLPKKQINYIIIALLMLQTFDTAFNVKRYAQQSQEIAQNISNTLQSGIPIILDTAGRGSLPPVLWHVNETTKVYASSQDHLVKDLPEISNAPTLLYISNLEYHENSIEKRQLVLQKLNEIGYAPTIKEQTLFDSTIYLLKKR